MSKKESSMTLADKVRLALITSLMGVCLLVLMKLLGLNPSEDPCFWCRERVVQKDIEILRHADVPAATREYQRLVDARRKSNSTTRLEVEKLQQRALALKSLLQKEELLFASLSAEVASLRTIRYGDPRLMENPIEVDYEVLSSRIPSFKNMGKWGDEKSRFGKCEKEAVNIKPPLINPALFDTKVVSQPQLNWRAPATSFSELNKTLRAQGLRPASLYELVAYAERLTSQGVPIETRIIRSSEVFYADNPNESKYQGYCLLYVELSRTREATNVFGGSKVWQIHIKISAVPIAWPIETLINTAGDYLFVYSTSEKGY